MQVETNAHDEKIKIPIAVLKVGESRCAQSFVEFPDAPVTFKLIQGSGPVYIHGQHLICDESVDGEIPMEDDDDLDEEEVCFSDSGKSLDLICQSLPILG